MNVNRTGAGAPLSLYINVVKLGFFEVKSLYANDNPKRGSLHTTINP